MDTTRLKNELDAHDHLPAYERLLERSIDLGKPFRSPLRQGDRHPSFNVYRGQNGRLLWKDFAMEGGDIYGLVMLVHSVKFARAVELVAGFLGVHVTDIPALPPSTLRRLRANPRPVSIPTIAHVFERALDQEDIAFWDQFGIDVQLLQEFKVVGAERIVLHTGTGREVVRYHAPLDPLYVFHIGAHIKAYRPLTTEKGQKYIGNVDRNDVFGWSVLRQATDVRVVVLNAGYKDGLALRGRFGTGVYPVAFISENTVPDEHVVHGVFQGHYAHSFVVYDNDDAGRINMQRVTAKFPFLRPIELGRSTPHKDVADMVLHQDRSGLATLHQSLFP